ncbi:glycosyltransferase family 4 protein [Mangrovimonas cancribranchiae]|uniref:Glycosyltransferase family 4 protein n=1 Tax=Mangrovimonas cancribranchiae TaxID=3080055 RepID=A0AAU6P9A3_9FLAO
MNRVFVHHRSPHHATYSGYAQLVTQFPEAKVITGTPSMPYKIAKIVAAMHKQTSGLFNTASVFKALELRNTLRQISSPTVVHFLNAERDVRYLVRLKKQYNQVVFCATFHKPPAVLEQRITDWKYLQHLDGAIAVGENQVDFLKTKLPNTKVRYIPHGVDTQFFKPNSNKKHPNKVLFVGQHLRDFNTFNACVPLLAEKNKDIQIHAVVNSGIEHRLKSHLNLHVHHGLSDEDLLAHYQTASVLLLPMLDSTACNSLLEAMACGVPIVTSRVGGNAEYLKETSAKLINSKDVEAHVMATKQALQTVSSKTNVSHIVNTFDWKNIAHNVNRFHTDIIKKI